MAAPPATLLLAMSVAVAVAGAEQAYPGPIVQTNSGPVQGVANTDGSNYWKGIPYATPPVMERRWTDPTPPTPWTSILVTSNFSKACPQTCHLPPGACQPVTEISEDCLYLNVYAPREAGSSASSLPVMVWIHGGRFEQGSGGVNLYDGTELSTNGPNIVVTLNYRLGVLGFYIDPELGVSGNYAIKDQQLALRWVNENIKEFGGDPTRVTIFGQSAGGASVTTHLLAPSSWPLFHQAIVQSSPLALPILTAKQSKSHYDVFVKDSTCKDRSKDDVLQCLRGATWENIIEAQTTAQHKIFLTTPLTMFEPWSPVADGTFLPNTFQNSLNNGGFAKVPIMIGHVQEEARMFVYEAFQKPLSEVEIEALVRVIYPGDHVAKAIFDLYPFPDPKPDDYRDWFSSVGTDYVIECPSRNMSNIYAAHGLNVYSYNFNHAWQVPGLWGPNYTFCEGHVCHGGELPYMFDSVNKTGIAGFTPAENVLAGQMVRQWASFAAIGSPNTNNGIEKWPLHNSSSDLVYTFELPKSKVVPHDRAKFCDEWDKLGYQFL